MVNTVCVAMATAVPEHIIDKCGGFSKHIGGPCLLPLVGHLADMFHEAFGGKGVMTSHAFPFPHTLTFRVTYQPSIRVFR